MTIIINNHDDNVKYNVFKKWKDVYFAFNIMNNFLASFAIDNVCHAVY